VKRFTIRYLTLVCLLLVTSTIKAQNVDSLKQLLYKPIADSTRIKILQNLASYYNDNEPENSLIYYKIALKLAQKKNDSSNVAFCLLSISNLYHTLGKFDSAKFGYIKALEIFIKKEDKLNILKCYNGIGIIYRENNNYNVSLKYYKRGLEIANEINNKTYIPALLNNIGLLYQYKRQRNEAINYYKQAVFFELMQNQLEWAIITIQNIGAVYLDKNTYKSFSDKKNLFKALEYNLIALKLSYKTNSKSNIALCLANIGDIYYLLNDFDLALKYYNSSLKIRKKIKNKEDLAFSYYTIALIFDKNNNYDSALSYYNLSLNLYAETDDNKGISLNLLKIGSILMAQKNIKKAIPILIKSLKSAKNIQDIDRIIQIYPELSKAYKEQNNTKLAYYYSLKEAELTDSLAISKPIINSDVSLAKLDSIANDSTFAGGKTMAKSFYNKKIDVNKTHILYLLIVLVFVGVVMIFYLKKKNINHEDVESTDKH